MEITADQSPSGKQDSPGLIATIKSDPFVLFMFLSMLLIGGDLFALHAGPITLRVVFPVMMVCFAFLFQRIGGHIVFDRPLGFLFFLLSVAAAASIQGSLDTVKSIGYTAWVLFDFFIIIGLTYNFAKLYPVELTLGLWFLVYRVHVVLLFLELLRNIVFRHSLARPHIWFYESSYLAIFMAGYFGSALFMFLRCGKPYRRDFIISILGMLATTSATGLFAMIFAVALNFLVAKQRIKLVLVTAAVLAGFLGILYVFFQGTEYYQLLGFLLSGRGIADLFYVILDRSGNRWIRVVIGWDAFLRHPWLGVGIGADATYMGATPFPDSVASYFQIWTDLAGGQPFVNILVEIAGTMGVAGLIPFFGILAYAGYSIVRSLRGREVPAAAALFMGFFTIFLAMQFESTFLRYYLWSPLGLGLGMLAHARESAAPQTTSRPAPLAGAAPA